MSTPVELYRITIDASVWTWTSGDQAVDYNGETYTPEPIGRDTIEQAQEINRANLKLRVPRTNPLAIIYLTTVPDYPASVTLYRQTGAGTAVYWKGRIVDLTAEGSEVTLECESVFTTQRLPGLRARYQLSCRHALYHRGCGLDPEDWAVDATLQDDAGEVLTVPEAALKPDGWYLGGMVRTPDGVLRWITAHSTDQLTLQRPFESLAAAGYGENYGNYYGSIALQIYPGCDRSKETCSDTFSNIENYGGFPWIPSRNPLDGSSIV